MIHIPIFKYIKNLINCDIMSLLTKEEKEVTKEAIDSRIRHLEVIIPYLRPDPAKRDKRKSEILESVKKKIMR